MMNDYGGSNRSSSIVRSQKSLAASSRVDAMFCARCGRENRRDAVFCVACGYRIARPSKPSKWKQKYEEIKRNREFYKTLCCMSCVMALVPATWPFILVLLVYVYVYDQMSKRKA